MAVEPLISKLNENLKMAQETLRLQLLSKIKHLADHANQISTTELRSELEHLVEDFLFQFNSAYQEFISYIEEELPDLTPAPKKPKPKKKKKEESEVQNKEFVRPTYIQKAFNSDGLRISKDARPMIMDFLNQEIAKDIERIKAQLPKFEKGEHEGEKKRITIKRDDITSEKLVRKEEFGFERELDSIALDINGFNYVLKVVLSSGDEKAN